MNARYYLAQVYTEDAIASLLDHLTNELGDEDDVDDVIWHDRAPMLTDRVLALSVANIIIDDIDPRGCCIYYIDDDRIYYRDIYCELATAVADLYPPTAIQPAVVDNSLNDLAHAYVGIVSKVVSTIDEHYSIDDLIDYDMICVEIDTLLE